MSDSVVVDTDVVSFVLKGDSRAETYRSHLEGRILIVSFMTLAELERWALVRNWGRARYERFNRLIAGFRVSAPDRDLCRAWATLKTEANRDGRPIETADAWIAATARHLRVPLVTHNARHYAGLSELGILSESPSLGP